MKSRALNAHSDERGLKQSQSSKDGMPVSAKEWHKMSICLMNSNFLLCRAFDNFRPTDDGADGDGRRRRTFWILFLSSPVSTLRLDLLQLYLHLLRQFLRWVWTSGSHKCGSVSRWRKMTCDSCAKWYAQIPSSPFAHFESKFPERATLSPRSLCLFLFNGLSVS